MLDIAKDIETVLRKGETVALATVVTTAGSTPRAVGARMAVRRGGGHLGTVGGGCGEATVIQAGLRALETGEPRLVRADMTEEVTDEAEAACGGTMDVLVRPFGAELLPVVQAVRQAAADRLAITLVTILEPEAPAGGIVVVARDPGPRLLAAAGLPEADATLLAGVLGNTAARPLGGTQRAGARLEGKEWSVLVEDLALLPVLVICGGGHIALPLSQMGKLLGFQVVVIDDRPSFANESRFPWADRTIAAPFGEALAGLSLDKETYAVVITRGHRNDVVCARRLLGRDLGYVGMIGSRRRVTAFLRALAAEGVPAETLARLHSPIGLDIGAETPAEIALAILAEIVQVRRGGEGRPLTLAPGFLAARPGATGGDR